MPEEVAGKVGGKVCTFGSFRLGVNSQGGDIDTLCIAPRHIDRIDFFTSFAELLKKQPETQKFMVKYLHACLPHVLILRRKNKSVGNKKFLNFCVSLICIYIYLWAMLLLVFINY